jgi:hypothetical protein
MLWSELGGTVRCGKIRIKKAHVIDYYGLSGIIISAYTPVAQAYVLIKNV